MTSMRGEDVLHFDAQAYWQRIMDPDQTPLTELIEKVHKKKSNMGVSTVGMFLCGAAAHATFGASMLLGLGVLRNVAVAEQKQELILKAIELRTTPTDIGQQSTSSALQSTSAPAPTPRLSYSAMDPAEAVWWMNGGHSKMLREGGANSVGYVPPSRLRRGESAEELECGICMENMRGRAVVGAPCGHTLCRGCRALMVQEATARGTLAMCHLCRTP